MPRPSTPGRGQVPPPRTSDSADRQRPWGYPADYETHARLSDGREVSIRPILPSDAAELAQTIRSADPATLHTRFLGAPPRPTAAILAELTDLDYVSRFALIARADDRGIAIARYAAWPTRQDQPRHIADVAIAVAPDWRRVGLATTLLQQLAHRAQDCGITEFTALTLATNRPVTELAHAAGARILIADGAAELNATLPTTDPETPSTPADH